MTEPSTAAVAAQTFAGSLAAVFIALIGVPPMALLWGALGAGAMLIFSRRTGHAELLAVLAAALVGAAGGQWIAHQFGNNVPTLVLASLVVGAGAKPLLSAAVARLQRAIDADKAGQGGGR